MTSEDGECWSKKCIFFIRYWGSGIVTVLSLFKKNIFHIRIHWVREISFAKCQLCLDWFHWLPSMISFVPVFPMVLFVFPVDNTGKWCSSSLWSQLPGHLWVPGKVTVGRWRTYFCLCVQSQAELCMDPRCGIARATGCMNPLEPLLPLGTNQLRNFDLR